MKFSYVYFWLIVMIAMLVLEGIGPGLISIWFAIGAAVSILVAALGAPLWLQIFWFIVVSLIALVLTRPLVHRYINSKVQPTNLDMVIGQDCVVTEEIDNIKGHGAVTVSGKTWTARCSENYIIPVGSVVTAVKIEGVKLIVKNK